MSKQTYSQKLRDPRWQKKRLEIFQRDNFACTQCGDTTTELQVHHEKYIYGRTPWEYEGDLLKTLCSNCHHATHFKPVEKYLPHQQTTENEMPFNPAEAILLKGLLLYGDLEIEPKYYKPNNRHKVLYEFLVGEFVRYNLQFESKELQQLFDIIAGGFYNQPNFAPDVEQYLNSENEVIKAFSRYIVESIHPLSPSWAQFGVFTKTDEELSPVAAIHSLFHLKTEKIKRLIANERDKLKEIPFEEGIPILEKISELDKIKKEINDDKSYWIG